MVNFAIGNFDKAVGACLKKADLHSSFLPPPHCQLGLRPPGVRCFHMNLKVLQAEFLRKKVGCGARYRGVVDGVLKLTPRAL